MWLLGGVHLHEKGVPVMQSFTPTATSAAVAGFSFWALVWAIALKLDTVASLFGFRSKSYSKMVQRWINNNKGLTLCITEVVNFSIHGVTNPAAVVFAVGGTAFNFLFVLFINPILCFRWKKNKIEAVHSPVSSIR
jgi:hypothetical protein